ncbi:MAG: sulfotransferase family protein [Myxococcota bacterium]
MPAPLFVLGAPRSGTTLLRVMLAGHPQLFSPPEMVIAPFATMGERRKKLTERFWEKGGLRRALMELCHVDVEEAKSLEATMDGWTVPEVYAWLQARLGDRVLVDKCPHLCADLPAMERLGRWFPDATWVWILRHPGSVTRSIENMPMAEVMLQGYAPDARDIWCYANRNVRTFLEGVPAARKVVIKYEDLVADARPAMEAVCAMQGLPFAAAMLDPYEGERMREGPPGARAVGDPNMAGRGRIQPELATAWLDGFDPASVSPETHALARELGYDLGALAAPPMAKATAALDALWDTARRLEREIRIPSDLDAVEGRRFLLRLVAHSTDLFVEHGDADFPAFHHAEGPTAKVFADCPDADYLRTPLRLGPGRRYRVWGRVPPGTTYVGMLLYGKGGRVGKHLRDADFVRPDGTFELKVSLDADADLRGDGDETALFVRQYFTDRAKQAPVELHVAFEGDRVAAPLTPEAFAAGVDRARRNLEASWKRTVETHRIASVAALNRFLPVTGDQLFPTPDNRYCFCWYRLGPDQCLVVRGTLPTARYVSFTLYDAWLESLDYTRATISRNHTQLATRDGAYELVISHRDLGVPNRLDTTGHLAGYVLLRALCAEGDVPVPSCEVKYERELG